MQNALQESLEDFERTGLEIWTTNWVTNDEPSKNAINKAERDLRKFKTTAGLIADKEKQLRKQGWSRRLPNYMPYGVLLKNEKGEWTVQSDATNKSLRGKLCVLDSGATFRKGFPTIGAVMRGIAHLDPVKENQFFTSRPIFIELETSKF